jgi:hypothetical protein
MGSPEDHVMQAGHAPTPFTAAEIRAASPAGHSTTVLIENLDREPMLRIIEFVSVTDDLVDMQFHERHPGGGEPGPKQIATAAWTDLQAHASFPVDSVAIENDTIKLPWAVLQCLRYTVTDADGTTIHWFATSHPGMPVRTNVWRGSELVYAATVLAIEDR